MTKEQYVEKDKALDEKKEALRKERNQLEAEYTRK